MNSKILIFSLFIVFSACKEKTYKPDGLTKLTNTEIIERAKRKDFPKIDSVVFKNEKGEIIPFDSIQKNYNDDKWAADSYADKNGTVKELILRKATAQDKELRKKLQKALDYRPPIKLVDVDCDKIPETLSKVHDIDQGMRKNGNTIDPTIDKKNLAIVISIIRKCGMPTLETVNQRQMSTIWLVFQHADNFHRKKYLPLLKKSAQNGDLSKSEMALMEDRILMEDGKPQIYGSQVRKNNATGDWVLYELKNPESVDKRRATVGLGPLGEYLNHWGIEFNVRQNKHTN